MTNEELIREMFGCSPEQLLDELETEMHPPRKATPHRLFLADMVDDFMSIYPKMHPRVNTGYATPIEKLRRILELVELNRYSIENACRQVKCSHSVGQRLVTEFIDWRYHNAHLYR